ncbi:MAG: tetratricopeptide repeat protein, partial [Povalibacter sp.]
IEAVEGLGKRANDRERAHAAAARKWLQGDFAGSVRAYGEILLDYPRDLFALQIAHVGDFFLGHSTLLRDRIAQVLPHWDASVPGCGFVFGMHAFGLEECAAYSQAEDAGHRALEFNRRDPWAIHAVAHVMESTGRIRDGIEWLSEREQDWSVENGFAYHNWWHLALYHLDLGDSARALDVYDHKLRATPATAPLEMLDASAMLWRLFVRGVDVGSRWNGLAETWAPLAEDAYYAFNDVHAVMAFVGANRLDLAETTIGALERKALSNDTNAMMSRDVGLPLAKAWVAFGTGHYEAAINLLLAVRPIANRFGGSHAQRDVVHLTLIEAALRAGRPRLARALAAERTQLKPTSPFNWQLTARALELSGDLGSAVKANEKAEIRRKAQHINYRDVA